MATWIVKRGELQRTVQDLDTLQEYVRNGRLRPDDLVRSEEGTQWVRAEDMAELAFVNIASPSSPPANVSSRFPKFAAVTVAAVVALLVLGGFWMRTRTPQYAIRQIEAAIKFHDLQKFQKYVDVDGVTADLFTLAQSNMTDSGSLAAAVATTMSSSLQDTLKHSITNMVESQESGAPRIVYDFVGLDSTYSGVQHVRRDGKLALVGLKFTPQGTPDALVFEIRMRDLGSHWQVAGLNVAQILASKQARDAEELVRIENERVRIARAAAEKHAVDASKAAASLSLSLSQSAVVGGPQSSLTATLALPDPAFEYISVAVSSDSAAVVNVPSVVTIPEGATAMSFIVTTFAVEKPESVTIYAEAYGAKRRAALTVNPPEEREYRVFEEVYLDPVAREYHVSTCPTAKGRRLFTSYRAMIVQGIPRAKDCANLPAPSTIRKSRH